MLYVTEAELRSNLREVNSDIKAVAKDLGGDIKYLNERINELEKTIKLIIEELKHAK